MSDPTRIDLDLDPLSRVIEGIAVHGHTLFSCPLISEVLPRLYQGGCVDKLELPSEIEHVVSLYPWEKYVLAEGQTRTEFTMYDSARGEIPINTMNDLAAEINETRLTKTVLVHCQAGLNRSGLVTAYALMVGPEQMSADDAIALLRSKRSDAVLCNPKFEAWLRNQGEVMAVDAERKSA